MFPVSTVVTLLAILATARAVASETYLLSAQYSGATFLDNFDFFTAPDPTHGFVQYVSASFASTWGLTRHQPDGSVYIGVDYMNVLNPNVDTGRSSVRITSKQAWGTGSLVVVDLAHVPGGQCGSWPAMWMVGPNWPYNGEIDIIEGVNSNQYNSMALHTSPGCVVNSGSNQLGTQQTTNCDASVNGNSGCGVVAPSSTSYGTGFNSVGGGIYATQITPTSISIWFFPRNAIPTNLQDPTTWGAPQANFQGCDVQAHFKNLQLVFDTTFCGDWAGNVWPYDATCAPKDASCVNYVAKNPGAFADAYWGINYVKVYTLGVAPATSTSTSKSTSMAKPTTTASSTSSAKTTSTSSSVVSSKKSTSTSTSTTTTKTTTTSSSVKQTSTSTSTSTSSKKTTTTTTTSTTSSSTKKSTSSSKTSTSSSTSSKSPSPSTSKPSSSSSSSKTPSSSSSSSLSRAGPTSSSKKHQRVKATKSTSTSTGKSSSSKVSTLGRRSMSISNSAAGSTATPDADPFMPSSASLDGLQKFELLGCYTSLPSSFSETAVGKEVVNQQMNLELCLSACREYVIAGVWNDTCVCFTELLPSASASASGSADPFLPAPTSRGQSQSVLQEGIEVQEQGCNLPCPGNGNQICGGGGGGGGGDAAVQKREGGKEGVKWSVYRNLYLNLNSIVLAGTAEGAAADRYTNTLATETGNGTGSGNITSGSNATTTVFRSAAPGRRGGRGRGLSLMYLMYLAVVGAVWMVVFL